MPGAPARKFSLWTSELTIKADVMGKAGGAYGNTNHPKSIDLSSRR